MGRVKISKGVVQEDETKENRGKRKMRLSISSEAEVESEADSNAESEGDLQCTADLFVDLKISLDFTEKENKVWLQQIKLFDFASLPWSEWQKNNDAALQLETLKKSNGKIRENLMLSPQLISKVFKLQYVPEFVCERCTDTVMRKEFGQPASSRGYFMLRNVEQARRQQLKWFLERVYLLMKFDYMGKDNYSVLHQAEQGGQVSWATILYDRIMQELQGKDKRRSGTKIKMGSILAALFAEDKNAKQESGKELHKEAGQSSQQAGQKVVEDFTTEIQGKPEKLKTFYNLMAAGYSPAYCREVAMTVESQEVDDNKDIFQGITEVPEPKTSVKLGTQWKKKRRMSVETGMEETGQRVVTWDATLKIAKEAVAAVQGKQQNKQKLNEDMDQKPEDSFQQQVNLLTRVQEFIKIQSTETAEMKIQLEKYRSGTEIGLHSQQLLKQKEIELVQLQMNMNSQKHSYEAELQEMRSQMKNLDRQLVQNKVSMTNFAEWTSELKDRMHAELSVLCDKNVSLQVENRFLMQRMEPLLALEQSMLAEQDEEVQGMLVSESDVEVMKKSMMDLGNQMWKEIRERLEAWVTKPFFSLQGAFVSQHESDLLQQIQELEE